MSYEVVDAEEQVVAGMFDLWDDACKAARRLLRSKRDEDARALVLESEGAVILTAWEVSSHGVRPLTKTKPCGMH